MLQSLLAERFNLTIHRETREFAVYELVAARGGLKLPSVTCVTIDRNGPPPPFGSKICGGVRTGFDRMEGFGVAMPKLIQLLADHIGRTVIDKTGFTRTFNFQIVFTPDRASVLRSGSNELDLRRSSLLPTRNFALWPLSKGSR